MILNPEFSVARESTPGPVIQMADFLVAWGIPCAISAPAAWLDPVSHGLDSATREIATGRKYTAGSAGRESTAVGESTAELEKSGNQVGVADCSGGLRGCSGAADVNVSLWGSCDDPYPGSGQAS